MNDFTSGQKDFLEELFLKINEKIESKSNEIKSEIKGKIDEFKKDVTGNIAVLERKINTLEEENKTLNKRILNLERKTRKNNIAIFGIEKTENSLVETVCNIFKNNLEVQINEEDLNDIYTLTNKNEEKCTIIVEFISYQKKMLVLTNSKKLKGSNIYIAKDQCREDINRNKILYKNLKESRQKGLSSYIKGNKLYISNIPYTAEQLESEDQGDKQPIVQEIEIEEERNDTEKLQTGTKPNKIKRVIEEQDIQIQNNQKKHKSEDITSDKRKITRANSNSRNK